MSVGLSRSGKTGIIIAASLAAAIIALTVVLVLSGCGGSPVETEASSTGADNTVIPQDDPYSSGNVTAAGGPEFSGSGSSAGSDEPVTGKNDPDVTTKPDESSDTGITDSPADTSSEITSGEISDEVTTKDHASDTHSDVTSSPTENTTEAERETETVTTPLTTQREEHTTYPVTTSEAVRPPVSSAEPEDPTYPPEQTTDRPPEDVTSADTTEISPPVTTKKYVTVPYIIVTGSLTPDTPTTTRPRSHETTHTEVTTVQEPVSITPETDAPRSPNEDAAPGVVVVPELRLGDTLRDTLIAPNGDRVSGTWRNSGGNISFYSDLPELEIGEKYRWWRYIVDLKSFYFGTYERRTNIFVIFTPDTAYPVINATEQAHTDQIYTVPPGTWW